MLGVTEMELSTGWETHAKSRATIHHHNDQPTHLELPDGPRVREHVHELQVQLVQAVRADPPARLDHPPAAAEAAAGLALRLLVAPAAAAAAAAAPLVVQQEARQGPALQQLERQALVLSRGGL